METALVGIVARVIADQARLEQLTGVYRHSRTDGRIAFNTVDRAPE
ncbi:hypothetical protein ACSD7O_00360 [Methylorubrum extorquens]